MANRALTLFLNFKARAQPPLERARATLLANLALVLARHKRIAVAPKVNWYQLAEIGLVVSALVVLCFVLIDRPVAMQRRQLPEAILAASEFFTRFGKSDWILIPSAIILLILLFLTTAKPVKAQLFRIYRWNIWSGFIFIGVGLPSLISTLLKRVIGRPRPSQLQEFGLFDFQHFNGDSTFASFPSGHSTTIGAFAMVMTLLAPRFRALYSVFALLVGFSRVGAGAHHPSDVIAGLAFGAIIAFFVAKLYESRGFLFLIGSSNWPTMRPSLRPFFKPKSRRQD